MHLIELEKVRRVKSEIKTFDHDEIHRFSMSILESKATFRLSKSEKFSKNSKVRLGGTFAPCT
jgi:hypothetical protein